MDVDKFKYKSWAVLSHFAKGNCSIHVKERYYDTVYLRENTEVNRLSSGFQAKLLIY